jgi:hypothetical protein
VLVKIRVEAVPRAPMMPMSVIFGGMHRRGLRTPFTAQPAK